MSKKHKRRITPTTIVIALLSRMVIALLATQGKLITYQGRKHK